MSDTFSVVDDEKLLVKNTTWFEKNKKIINSILVVMLCIIGLFKFIDEHTHRELDASIKDGALAYASVKGVSVGISILKGSEFSLGVVSMRLGEALEPINETLVYTSHVIMTALASLGLQKFLLLIMGSALGNAILLISALIYLSTIWIKGLNNFECKVKSIFYFIVFLRFVIAVSLGANALVDKMFINEQINHSINNTEILDNELRTITSAISEEKESIQGSDDPGFWESAKNKISTATQGAAGIKNAITDLPAKFDSLIIDFMNLIALFFLKTILIPIGFILLIKKVFVHLKLFG
ncbi:hypothetical protein [Shewanella sp. 4_MG-2023]|uniref:hypothetical protein n=1 Tax=Shewanella sp. 4_MG-2023 TaxID=3062652 RepID=UPI0026E3B63B|nr:hypothetical protein [Shewanella sp. 4_MG-2023]MDO6678439.1 hypothetical protein [Shewanella sp. 4_MG-2023]